MDICALYPAYADCVVAEAASQSMSVLGKGAGEDILSVLHPIQGLCNGPHCPEGELLVVRSRA